MDSDRSFCGDCGHEFYERELVKKTAWHCPSCDEVVRQGVAMADVQAEIDGDLTAINGWLADYAASEGQKVGEKAVGEGKPNVWAIDTPQRFACECVYDRKRCGIVKLQLITRDGVDVVGSRLEPVVSVAAKFGLQPHATRLTEVDFGVGESSTDMAWGLYQLLTIGHMNPQLLLSVVERISRGMEAVLSELCEY